MNYLSSMFTTILFIGYLLLWKIKQREVFKAEGVEVKVISKATRPIQRYFGHLEKIMTISIVAIIIIHTFLKDYVGATNYIGVMDVLLCKIIGLIVGIGGLCLCRIAQTTIGKSWRVGIDEGAKPGLITNGIYQYIRNPTYTGLYFLCVGVFLINPTFIYSLWILTFFLMMEFQVRCEEEYLEELYGEEYTNYCKNTKRYFPVLY